jgi:hypothetical protein
MTYIKVIAAGTPICRGKHRPGAGGERWRSLDLTMAIPNELSYPRPLTADEHDLIEAMLGAVRSGVSRYIGQLEAAEVVGGCGCGCPSIDLVVASAVTDAAPSPVLLADAESPEGVPVGVILWARGGCLSGLEVHPWDGTDVIRLPHAETLRDLRTAG